MKNKLLSFYFNNKNVILITLLGLAILFIGYKIFFSKKSTVTKESNPEYYEDYTTANPNLKGKTLEELGLKAQENYVIAEKGNVRRTQNYAQNNTVHELKFGTVIYTKVVDSLSGIDVDEELILRENKKGYVAVYADKPKRITDVPVGFMDEKEIITKEKFKDFKPEIKIEEVVKISPVIIDIVESNADFDGTPYMLSDNAKRNKETLIFGDYNNDGVRDMAAIVDNVNGSKSGLLLFFKTDEGYQLALKKGFGTKVTARTIKKETPITLKTESTLFPIDGVYITTKNSAFFHVYDTEIGEFMVIEKEKPQPVTPTETKPVEKTETETP